MSPSIQPLLKPATTTVVTFTSNNQIPAVSHIEKNKNNQGLIRLANHNTSQIKSIKPLNNFVTANNNQQIIVIPQSMLANKMNTVVANGNPKIAIKRAIPPASPTVNRMEPTEDQPPRKRANLDHLTPEEKLQRRKMKNRVAAQNARDKKKVKMDEMEEIIQDMRGELKKLRDENQKLMQINARLLAGQGINLKQLSPSIATSDYASESEDDNMSVASSMEPSRHELAPSPMMTASPTLTPVSTLGVQTVLDRSVVVSSISEPAELTNELQPKERIVDTAAMLSNQQPLRSCAERTAPKEEVGETEPRDLSLKGTVNSEAGRSSSIPLKKRWMPSALIS